MTQDSINTQAPVIAADAVGVYQLAPLASFTKDAEPEGMRLARLIYKGEGNVSKGCYVPSLAWANVSDKVASSSTIQDAILNMLEAKQNQLMKATDSNGRSPTANDIGLDSIISLLEAEEEAAGESSRLTKAVIGSWFDANLSDVLTVAFADKLGVSDTPNDADIMRIKQAIAGYKGKLEMLAGGKTSFDPAVITKLQEALSLGAIDDMNRKLAKKLTGMSEKQVDDLADLL